MSRPVSEPGQTLSLADLAARLKMSTEQFRSRRGILYRKGFPRPLPGCRNVWSARRVAAWIDGGIDPELDHWSVASSHEPLDAIVQEGREALYKHYGIITGSAGDTDDASSTRRAARRRPPLQTVE